MAASFAGGDLAGGVLSGLDQLATHAGRLDPTAVAASRPVATADRAMR